MTARRVLWLDPSFGASGDMLLGTFIGLGADLDAITTALETLSIGGWSINATAVTRCGLSAHRAEVTTEPAPFRRWSEIDTILAASGVLPDSVRAGARATFRRLGEVEATAHDVPIDDVHFHEVGAVDAIVDIVGTWLALDRLAVDDVIVGPVGLGHGTVVGSHGILPLPAPATAALLAGATVRPLDVELETCTPTGAALLATIGRWGPMPNGTLLSTGRGAGGRDPQTHPNVLTGHVLSTPPLTTPTLTPPPLTTPLLSADPLPDAEASSAGAPASGSEATDTSAVVLATNLDDVSPEVLGYVIDRLLAEGADDAWIVPIVMKKQRPAHQLCVLTSAALAPRLRSLISAETGTLGIRQSHVTKYSLPRTHAQVELHGLPVSIKVGPFGAKPEHDDLVAVAAASGVPLRDLALQALARWRDISHR